MATAKNVNPVFVGKKVVELEMVIGNMRRGLAARRKLRKILGENLRLAKLSAKALNRASISTKAVDRSRIEWKNKLHENEAILTQLKPMLKTVFEELAVYKLAVDTVGGVEDLEESPADFVEL